MRSYRNPTAEAVGGVKRAQKEEYQLGYKQNGPIKERLESHGLSHENYQIPTEELPPYFSGEGPFKGGIKIGHGSERTVYLNPNDEYPVKKYPHAGVSTSHGGPVPVRTTHFDKLIESFERVMSLRIFARIMNEYTNWASKQYPQDRQKIPYFVVPKSIVDRFGVIHEPLLPEGKKAILRTEYRSDVLFYLPKVIKKLYVYLDQLGGGNIYKVGETKSDDPIFHGRPKYHAIDGAKFFLPTSDDIEEELDKVESSYLGYQLRNAPKDIQERWLADEKYNRDKARKCLVHFKKILSKITQEELNKTLKAIDNVFGAK